MYSSQLHWKFKKISEAYQVLSDPKLRKRYNEYGEQNGIKPDGGFVDPEEFFRQSFGGERFVDIIGEISIGRDMREALETAEEEGNDQNLTPEQKAEREAQKEKTEQERAETRAKRVETLAAKLINKLSLYTELPDTSPSSVAAFTNIIQIEAEDLKHENYGVELLHAIGGTYTMKANQYLGKGVAFGLGGMFHSVREKGYIFSETVGTLRTALDLQSSFSELQKAEEKGLTEEERQKLEEEAAQKVGREHKVVVIISNVVIGVRDLCRVWKPFGVDRSLKLKVYCGKYATRCSVIPPHRKKLERPERLPWKSLAMFTPKFDLTALLKTSPSTLSHAHRMHRLTRLRYLLFTLLLWYKYKFYVYIFFLSAYMW